MRKHSCAEQTPTDAHTHTHCCMVQSGISKSADLQLVLWLQSFTEDLNFGLRFWLQYMQTCQPNHFEDSVLCLPCLDYSLCFWLYHGNMNQKWTCFHSVPWLICINVFCLCCAYAHNRAKKLWNWYVTLRLSDLCLTDWIIALKSFVGVTYLFMVYLAFS